MPSSKIKQVMNFPPHWQKALEFLASRAEPSEIVVETSLQGPRINTLHTKALAMKRSVLAYPDWDEAVTDFVKRNLFGIERRKVYFGQDLVFKRKIELKPLSEVMYGLV